MNGIVGANDFLNFYSGTAGDNVTYNVLGDQVQFFDDSDAGMATIVCGSFGTQRGNVSFFNESSAAGATITVLSGATLLFNPASVGTATVINHGYAPSETTLTLKGGMTTVFGPAPAASFFNGGGTVKNGEGGVTNFQGSSSAGQSTFICDPAAVAGALPGSVFFGDTSTAENGVFTANGATVDGAAGGQVRFSTSSGVSAGNGTFIMNGGQGDQGGGLLLLWERDKWRHRAC